MTMEAHLTRRPKLSVVTASFNRAEFLAEAIDSVLEQGYTDLEYVVVDGGSTDGTAQIVASYAERLAWWVSERDGGQYDAINKGFAHTTGEVMAWLNSDDKYLPWTFSIVSEIFASLPEVEWLTSAFPLTWDERGRAVACALRPGFSQRGFLRGEYLPGGNWYSTGYLQQESTFWRRSLWERVGGQLDTGFSLAADFDLWMRFSKVARLYAAAAPLGGFRAHANQRSREHAAYFDEALRSMEAHGGRPYSRLESKAHRLVQSRLPGSLRRRAVSAGVLERRPFCVYDADRRRWFVDDLLTRSGAPDAASRSV
jgi:glycosyltransferase involved in cell wall biosynthesis